MSIPSATSYVPNATPRVAFKASAGSLLDTCTRAADRDQVSPAAFLAVADDATGVRPLKDASRLKDGEALLPLQMGALRAALQDIAKGDSWLLTQPPVIYTGRDLKVHIDFVNYAGFAIAPNGGIIWRAVNPA